MKSYAEKLKDPRWQKKRLEIMQRDEFKCRFCENDKDTLNIHHLVYEKNKDPWDIDDKYLITLCESCHSAEYEFRNTVLNELKEILIIYPCPYTTFENWIDVIYNHSEEVFEFFNCLYWQDLKKYINNEK